MLTILARQRASFRGPRISRTLQSRGESGPSNRTKAKPRVLKKIASTNAYRRSPFIPCLVALVPVELTQLRENRASLVLFWRSFLATLRTDQLLVDVVRL